MTGNRLIAAIISLLAIAALSAIVLVAIGADRLWSLIGGVGVLGVIGVALSVIGVALYTRMSASRAQREELLYHHAEAMAKAGLKISDRRALSYELIPNTPQIAAPKAEQGVSQIILNPNALRESAVNLLLLSMRQIGGDQNRIASGPECAAAGVNGYTPRTWSKVVNEFLAPRYGVVTARGAIDHGGGTFVPEKIGTVEALYHKVMTDSAVDVLPGIER